MSDIKKEEHYEIDFCFGRFVEGFSKWKRDSGTFTQPEAVGHVRRIIAGGDSARMLLVKTTEVVVDA